MPLLLRRADYAPEARSFKRHANAYNSAVLASRPAAFGRPLSKVLATVRCAAALEAEEATAVLPTPAEPVDEPAELLHEPNPLLQDVYFPLFDTIKAEHVVPALQRVLEDTRAQLAALEGRVRPSWEGAMAPMERLIDRLDTVWGVVEVLREVDRSEEMVTAAERAEALFNAATDLIFSNKMLESALLELMKGPQWRCLSEYQQQVVEEQLEAFNSAEQSLEDEERQRLTAVRDELRQLGERYRSNVDKGGEFARLVTSWESVEGLTDLTLQEAADAAREAGFPDANAESGPWLLDFKTEAAQQVLERSTDRSLREEVYRARTRWASQGDTDNGPLVVRMLDLRHKEARLLGCRSYAECVMEDEDISPKALDKLLEDLRRAAWKAAKKELEDVKQFAQEQGFSDVFEEWDHPYWVTRYMEEVMPASANELRPYLSLDGVLRSLFALVQCLFGVTVEAAEGGPALWHEDVRLYVVKEGGQVRGYMYMDPFSRHNKSGGWQYLITSRSRRLASPGQAVRPALIVMALEIEAPEGGPALMTIDEVEELFHEFGHALEHMLMECDESLLCNLKNVSNETEEVVSQFMEYWLYEASVLQEHCRHHETGEPMPEAAAQLLKGERKRRAGTRLLKSLRQTLTDLELHRRYRPGGPVSIRDIVDGVSRKTCVTKPSPEERYENSLQDFDSSDGASTLFRYELSQVMSAHAFHCFEKAGLDNEAAVRKLGRQFREQILAGMCDSDQLGNVREFCGSRSGPKPLLHHLGLIP